jgi:hypothetical protein
MPKKIAQSHLKKLLYDSFENQWYTMVWENGGSTGKADIWWNDTIEWLEHVSLEKIDPAIPFPGTPQVAEHSK